MCNLLPDEVPELSPAKHCKSPTRLLGQDMSHKLCRNCILWLILQLGHLILTLVDYIVVTEEQGRPKCGWRVYMWLGKTEDKWICRLVSFYGNRGLNSTDEIKVRSRVNFVGNWFNFVSIYFLATTLCKAGLIWFQYHGLHRRGFLGFLRKK